MRFLFVALLAGSLGQGDGQHTITFARDAEGKVPPGWKVDRTGDGKGSDWRVRADASAPSGKGFVLAQTAESPKKMFNLCVFQDAKVQDVELTISFKATRGETDQGGGPVWRFQDANNYYIARMNPLENNFRVYKVVDGKRIQLDSAKDIKIPANTWHTIKIRQVGAKITCHLDGAKLLEAEDGTLSAAGKIGLWTKADAQTSFDQIQWTDLGKK